MDERGLAFRWKDYRVEDGAKGKRRHQTMAPGAENFMRRFLHHVQRMQRVWLGGVHRIRHGGLLANDFLGFISSSSPSTRTRSWLC